MIDNAARGRFNAWLLDRLDGYMHRRYGRLKTDLFARVPRTILEIGPGSGANFRYYPAGTQVIAVEPNVRMHERLRRAAARHGLDLRLCNFGGEALEIDTASVEFACSTLVLCSVTDPAAVVAEIRRVLLPGARFVCIDHVRAPRGSFIHGLQRAIRRPWRWVFEGCDLRNETEAVLNAAGFRDVEIEQIRIPTLFLPIRYQISAICTA